MATNRIERISSEYMQALAQALRTVKDPRVSGGMLSITRCQVTGDLRYAKVYLSVMDSPVSTKELTRGLKACTGYLRHTVGEKLQLRAAPEPVFVLDDSISRGAHILEKLHEISVEDARREHSAEAASPETDGAPEEDA